MIFGGRSGEHEVSIRSARSVVEAIDRTRYEVVPIAITEEGPQVFTRVAQPAAPQPEEVAAHL